MNETQVLDAIQKDLRTALLLRVTSGKATTLEALQRAVTGLPEGATLAALLDEARKRAADLIKALSKERREAFGRFEATFIKNVNREGTPYKEMQNG